jgi:hypothetical protein
MHNMKNLQTFEEFLNENMIIKENFDKKDSNFLEIANIARKYKVPGSSEKQRQNAIDAIINITEIKDAKQAVVKLMSCVPQGKMEKFIKEITPLAKELDVEFEKNGTVKGFDRDNY